MNSQVRLHLGCYDRRIHGWINVDVRPECNPDLVDDCFLLKTLSNNYADVIYSSHMIEHTDRKGVHFVLKRWFEVLKPGGVLYVACPDLEAAFAHYFYYKKLPALYAMIYGSQNYPEDYHKVGFDFDTLKAELEAAGFINPDRYDWKKTDFWYIDDHSHGYAPHMDFNGKLMSLNMCAWKPSPNGSYTTCINSDFTFPE